MVLKSATYKCYPLRLKPLDSCSVQTIIKFKLSTQAQKTQEKNLANNHLKSGTVVAVTQNLWFPVSTASHIFKQGNSV